MIRRIETDLAGSGEAVLLLVEFLDAGVDGPAFVAGVENAHDAFHGYVYGGLEVERLFVVLPVLRVERGDGGNAVQLGMQHAVQAYGKGRMDVHDIDAARNQLGLEDGVQYGCGDVVVGVDER